MSVKKARKKQAIKKSVAGIGKRLSRGADRVADIILEDGKDGKKGKKIADETVAMFKDMKQQLKDNNKDVTPVDLIGDAAFCVGRVSGIVGREVKTFFKDLKA
ncbi:MAG: hypothetical protein WCO69_00295 [Candidatus Omnitrophota bacterium]